MDIKTALIHGCSILELRNLPREERLKLFEQGIETWNEIWKTSLTLTPEDLEKEFQHRWDTDDNNTHP